MISKKKAAIIIVIVALVASVGTMALSSLVSVPFFGRVIVSQKDYSYFKTLEDKYDKIDAVSRYIEDNYLKEGDITDKKLEDGSLKGLVASLGDPYSVYMDADEFKSFKESSSGKFVGIGIVVSPNEDNKIQIISPIKDSPGEKAGLKAGDLIVKVNGKEYNGDQIDEAVRNMKGEEGTEVTITILRKDSDGKEGYFDKTIVRAEVLTPSVESKMLEGDIGYVMLSQFEDTSYDDFKEALDDLKSRGMKGLVLDIRDNGGGSLQVAGEIIDELIPEGTIVYTEDRDGNREYIKSKKNELGLPLAVIVNGYSASASEILTAAVQDSGTGTIVGTKTYGKGVVQIVEELSDGSGLKLTISEYFSPKGRNIDKKGIEPDVAVELPESVERIGPDNLAEDVQLQKAIDIVKSKSN